MRYWTFILLLLIPGFSRAQISYELIEEEGKEIFLEATEASPHNNSTIVLVKYENSQYIASINDTNGTNWLSKLDLNLHFSHLLRYDDFDSSCYLFDKSRVIKLDKNGRQKWHVPINNLKFFGFGPMGEVLAETNAENLL